MKCASHPDKDATAHCSVCKRPLCDQCALPQGDGTFLCDRCAMLEAFQGMREKREERLSTKEIERRGLEAKRKKRVYIRYLILIPVAVVIAAAELFFYFRISKPDVEQLILSENPVAMATLINQAIEDYARDHGGVVPKRLEDLLGEYLPSDEIGPDDLKGFSYI